MSHDCCREAGNQAQGCCRDETSPPGEHPADEMQRSDECCQQGPAPAGLASSCCGGHH